ncbi:inverse autotransporter beta-barrel domain-containing protein [Serratia marcescens]|uniref:Invasin n=1 Tax=Serratia marcescens TaxID=615 RepID=A0A5C7BLJ4_SERMA|nr:MULTISPECIES: inverse autotransporter beta-barrel domain-containing protein [Serratia]TXE24600.1 inverse autotransporter beta-barrel domain-containing protein [Serratia marcescens]TXE53323.1 inverse autotransporter beta-barrel domain-containing protein [Serratia marcescens]
MEKNVTAGRLSPATRGLLAALIVGSALPAAGNEPGHDAAPQTDADTRTAATYAARAGRAFAAGEVGQSTAAWAGSAVAGAAGDRLSQWLGQFGTARVQLDTDARFTLRNAQLDVLLPLYDRDDWLAFTQSSLHRTEDRTQANLGVGLRTFYDDAMLGGNAFLDHDLTGAHTRAGLGIEYWRDFMKLGANTYLRLSDWKTAQDLPDYEARPANGWDLRAEAWLPALPQLGGRLTFAQYYGDAVALFGRDRRQRDPYALTAGLDYTPVPLLTLSAAHSQGAAGENETRLGIAVQYRLGMPWSQQTDPAAVPALRTLAGSRHDLVARDNDIVLTYRKKTLIRLQTVAQMSGEPGELHSLEARVTSTHGLARIDWSAPALLAAGGRLVQTGGDAGVRLPDYLPGAGADNVYTVSGVAVDREGNRSAPAQTRVTVRPPAAPTWRGTFLPAHTVLPADGRHTQTLTLTLTDARGQPADLPATAITVETGPRRGATVSAPVRQAPGVYSAIVTAGREAETLTLTPVVDGTRLPAATVTVGQGTPDPAHSTFTVTPDRLTVGEKATLTFTAGDAGGAPLAGLADDLTLRITDSDGRPVPAGAVTTGTVTESGSAPGTYTAPLAGAQAGDYTLTPLYSGAPMGLPDIILTLLPAARLDTVSVNGATFAVTDGFPTTGFQGATFTLAPDTGSAADYVWASDAHWVAVSDGVVRFTGQGQGGTVTLTATPKQGGDPLHYAFTLTDWYTPTPAKLPWLQADAHCSQTGAALATRAQLSKGKAVRGVGTLWSEWGDMGAYAGAGVLDQNNWTSDARASLRVHYLVNLDNGHDGSAFADGMAFGALCRRAL